MGTTHASTYGPGDVVHVWSALPTTSEPGHVTCLGHPASLCLIFVWRNGLEHSFGD